MKFSTSLVSFLCAAAASFGVANGAPAAPDATSVSVSFDQTYDNASNSLDIVACSDGSNGMITKGFTTFGSLPNFPNIGGSFSITGFNSASCGSCWQVGRVQASATQVAASKCGL
ncbi:cerato-platanin family protein [Abortiporus biennis]